jgi:cyclophilin family peptidyl-prolyl cis-trans isomerase
MARLFVALGFFVVCLLPPALLSGDQTAPAASNPVLLLETVKGEVEIELWPVEAPKSVAHILALTGRNFYRAQRVHWVQSGVIQFGDPLTRDMTKQYNWGTGGSGRPVNIAESSKKPFLRGSVGLAYRDGQKPTSADSQIFILKVANPALVGKYALLGRVTKGMNVVDKLAMGDEIKRFVPKSAAK